MRPAKVFVAVAKVSATNFTGRSATKRKIRKWTLCQIELSRLISLLGSAACTIKYSGESKLWAQNI